MTIDLLTTIDGSLLAEFFPRGWDLNRMDRIAALPRNEVTRRAEHWHASFDAVPFAELHELEVEMGLEIAMQVYRARSEGHELAMILPVGPMGMYRWAVKLLQRLRVPCDHVHGFNMDEWSDAEGNTLDGSAPGSFEHAMEQAFYGPLGELTVPREQRYFATRAALPTYSERIQALRDRGAQLVVVYGIGRVLHIASGNLTSLESSPTSSLGVKRHTGWEPASIRSRSSRTP